MHSHDFESHVFFASTPYAPSNPFYAYELADLSVLYKIIKYAELWWIK